jgi:hypothetical protein
MVRTWVTTSALGGPLITDVACDIDARWHSLRRFHDIPCGQAPPALTLGVITRD